MTTIITREIGASPKGSPLTNSEVDQNFINLNTDKADSNNLAYTGTLTGGTGVIAIGTNQIYKDASGNVGIGTGAPNAGSKLHLYSSVVANTGILRIQHSLSTYNAGLVCLNANSTNGLNIFVDGTGGSKIIQGDNSYLILGTNNAERMRLTSTGIALIGTTAASGANLLQVNSDARINGITVGLGGGASPHNTALGLNTLASNLAAGVFNTAIGYNCLSANVLGANSAATGWAALLSSTTAIATFGTITAGSGYTNGTYVDIQLTYSSGSTAITYPLVNITVAGGVVTVCTLVVAASGTSGGAGFKDITTVMSCANTVIGGGAGGGFAISPATLVSGYGNCGFGSQALTANTTGSGNCAMGVYALVGNTVGNNNTTVGNQAMFTNQKGSTNCAFGVNALRQNVAGSSNSAFGVNALLNVTGSVNTGIGAGAGSSITTGNNNVVIGGYTGAAAPISATGSYYVVLSDGAGNVRQTIDSAGKVGINTTAPNSLLHINGTTGFAVGAALTGDNAIIPSAGGIVLNGGTQAGLSTYAPIGGSTSVAAINQYFDSTDGFKRYLDIASVGALTGAGSSIRFLTCQNGTAERMRIDPSGNVGIGTTSPTTTVNYGNLSLGGVTGGQLIFQNGGAVNSTLYGNASLLNVGTQGYLVFSAGGTSSERMRIDYSGNVGIGTSSPTGKLDVAGTIKTSGYTVATLPTGVVGARAYVTDASTPVFGATVVTGGAVTIPVFYNGTNWIVG